MGDINKMTALLPKPLHIRAALFAANMALPAQLRENLTVTPYDGPWAVVWEDNRWFTVKDSWEMRFVKCDETFPHFFGVAPKYSVIARNHPFPLWPANVPQSALGYLEFGALRLTGNLARTYGLRRGERIIGYNSEAERETLYAKGGVPYYRE